MKKFLLLTINMLWLVACGNSNEAIVDDSPDPPFGFIHEGPDFKKVYVWIDAQANLDKFGSPESIEMYIKRIKNAGIDGIYLNVKPAIGYALYESDVLPYLYRWGDNRYFFQFDYLSEFLKYGKKYKVDVYAAIDAVGYGIVKYRQGLVYEDDSFDGVTQVRMIGNNPNNLEDMRDRPGAVAANLSMIHPKSRELLRKVCREIVTKYPGLKGICLDVLRFEDVHYCVSDYSMQAFAQYIGETSVNRNDLITAGGGQGKLFNKWIEFRTHTITDAVQDVRNIINEINPDLKFHLWSAGQWSSRYEVGQNWASVNYQLPGGPYTSSYQELGFAHLIDAIVPGAYTSRVWEGDGPWSVEYYVSTYPDIVKGETEVINSITVYSYNDPKKLQDAMRISLQHTDGLMLFDLCHICEQNVWNAVTETIKEFR